MSMGAIAARHAPDGPRQRRADPGDRAARAPPRRSTSGWRRWARGAAPGAGVARGACARPGRVRHLDARSRARPATSRPPPARPGAARLAELAGSGGRRSAVPSGDRRRSAILDVRDAATLRACPAVRRPRLRPPHAATTGRIADRGSKAAPAVAGWRAGRRAGARRPSRPLGATRSRRRARGAGVQPVRPGGARSRSSTRSVDDEDAATDNPFAPRAEAAAGGRGGRAAEAPPPGPWPRRLRELRQGRSARRTRPRSYAQFGPLSAYPRAQRAARALPAAPGGRRCRRSSPASPRRAEARGAASASGSSPRSATTWPGAGSRRSRPTRRPGRGRRDERGDARVLAGRGFAMAVDDERYPGHAARAVIRLGLASRRCPSAPRWRAATRPSRRRRSRRQSDAAAPVSATVSPVRSRLGRPIRQPGRNRARSTRRSSATCPRPSMACRSPRTRTAKPRQSRRSGGRQGRVGGGRGACGRRRDRPVVVRGRRPAQAGCPRRRELPRLAGLRSTRARARRRTASAGNAPDGINGRHCLYRDMRRRSPHLPRLVSDQDLLISASSVGDRRLGELS